MTDEQHGYLEDSAGNKSHKRLWASILFIVGVLLVIVIIVYDLINPNVDLQYGIKSLEIVFAAACALSGFSVIEIFGNKNKNE